MLKTFSIICGISCTVLLNLFCFAEEQAVNSEEAVTLSGYLKQNSEIDPQIAESNFYEADRDGDLLLTAAERSDEATGVSPYQRFTEFDEDGNQLLNINEYTELREKTSEDVIRREFLMFDLDEDNQFSYREFLESPPGANDAEIRFRRWDVNRDAFLSLEEFSKRFCIPVQAKERSGFFYRDQNGDRKLSHEEFTTPVEAWQPHLKSRYAIFDTNNDLQVSCAEYIAPHIGKPSEQAATREAKLFDKNQDEILEVGEFAYTPQANLSTAEKIVWFDKEHEKSIHRLGFLAEVPQSSKFDKAIWFAKHDFNLDHKLSLAELEAGERLPEGDFSDIVDQQIGEIKQAWNRCNINEDGMLSAEECDKFVSQQSLETRDYLHQYLQDEVTWEKTERVLQSGFGLIREDGGSLHFDDGTIINHAFVSMLDEDGNNEISQAEFIRNFFEGKNTTHHFRKYDADQDDVLSDFELIDQRLFSINYVHDFCRLDANFDGELTRTEIIEGVNLSQQPVCQFLVKAFDKNADNKLNLAEFSVTPLANPLLDWYAPQHDDDNNAQLDPPEFYPECKVVFPLLCEMYFGNFDLDSDGQLSFAEFPLRLDMPKLPPDIAYQVLDQNKDSIFNSEDFRLLASGGFEEFNTTDSRLMNIEDAILYADQDEDGGLSQAEVKENWSSIRTAFSGHFDPPSGDHSIFKVEPTSDQPNSPQFKTTLLILFNILLLLGLIGLAVYRVKAARS